MPDGNDKQHRDTVRMLSLVTNISITTVVCILIGIGLGWLIDRLLGTSPLFLIILIILGIAAAFKNIYDIAQKIK